VSEEETILDEPAGRGPLSSPRLASAVSFGLRAATLAGLVLSAATAAGLPGVFDGPAFMAHPTCCPPDHH
jgi:hypothetical protein